MKVEKYVGLKIFYLFILFWLFWLHWVLVAASGTTLLVVRSTGPGVLELSSYGSRA